MILQQLSMNQCLYIDLSEQIKLRLNFKATKQTEFGLFSPYYIIHRLVCICPLFRHTRVKIVKMHPIKMGFFVMRKQKGKQDNLQCLFSVINTEE